MSTTSHTLAGTWNAKTPCASERQVATPNPSHRPTKPAKTFQSFAGSVLWLTVAIRFTFAALTRGATPPLPNYPVAPFGVGSTAPIFTGVDQYGRLISTKNLAGKWVLLNFVTGWSQYSTQMSANAQTLANLLRQNKVPFAYLTIVLQDAANNNAGIQTALDWAAN